MKRTLFIAIAALLMGNAAFAQTPKAEIKTDLDSLSYDIGVANSKGLKNYIQGQLGVDTIYMDEFYKGLQTVVKTKGDKKLAAYFAGIQIGQQITGQIFDAANREIFGSDSVNTINLDLLIAGIIDGSTGATVYPTEEQMMSLQNRVGAYHEKFVATAYAENKKQSEDFIAAKAKEKGIKKLPGGTLYRELVKGNGKQPKIENTVEIIYEGRLIDGTVFDSSEGNAVSIPLSQLIPSWQEAIPQMKEGCKWELFIPYDQAYNERDMGIIKPFSALVFTVELINAEVEHKAPETLNLPENFQMK